MYTGVCGCMWRLENEYLSQELCTLVFETASHWTWSSSVKLGRLPSALQEPTCLFTPSTKPIVMTFHAGILSGCWGSKLGGGLLLYQKFYLANEQSLQSLKKTEFWYRISTPQSEYQLNDLSWSLYTSSNPVIRRLAIPQRVIVEYGQVTLFYLLLYIFMWMNIMPTCISVCASIHESQKRASNSLEL